jgi:hypothetical protein
MFTGTQFTLRLWPCAVVQISSEKRLRDESFEEEVRTRLYTLGDRSRAKVLLPSRTDGEFLFTPRLEYRSRKRPRETFRFP